MFAMTAAGCHSPGGIPGKRCADPNFRSAWRTSALTRRLGMLLRGVSVILGILSGGRLTRGAGSGASQAGIDAGITKPSGAFGQSFGTHGTAPIVEVVLLQQARSSDYRRPGRILVNQIRHMADQGLDREPDSRVEPRVQFGIFGFESSLASPGGAHERVAVSWAVHPEVSAVGSRMCVSGEGKSPQWYTVSIPPWSPGQKAVTAG